MKSFINNHLNAEYKGGEELSMEDNLLTNDPNQCGSSAHKEEQPDEGNDKKMREVELVQEASDNWTMEFLIRNKDRVKELFLPKQDHLWLIVTIAGILSLFAFSLASWSMRGIDRLTARLDQQNTVTAEDVNKLLEAHSAALNERLMIPLRTGETTQQITVVQGFELVGQLLANLQEQVSYVSSSVFKGNKK